jgi:hypothetical protein
LYLFSFFNTHDLQVWSLMDSPSSCVFLSQFLSLLSKSSSVSFL